MENKEIINNYLQVQKSFIKSIDSMYKLKNGMSFTAILEYFDKLEYAKSVCDTSDAFKILRSKLNMLSMFINKRHKTYHDAYMIYQVFEMIEYYLAVKLIPTFVINKNDTKVFDKLLKEQKLNNCEYQYITNSEYCMIIPVIIDESLYAVRAFSEISSENTHLSQIRLLYTDKPDYAVSSFIETINTDLEGNLEAYINDIYRSCPKLETDKLSSNSNEMILTNMLNVHYKKVNSGQSQYSPAIRCNGKYCNKPCKHSSNASTKKNYELFIKMAVYAFIKSNCIDTSEDLDGIYAPMLFSEEKSIRCVLDKHDNFINVAFEQIV